MSRLRTGTVKSKNGTDIAEIVYAALAEKVLFLFYVLYEL